MKYKNYCGDYKIDEKNIIAIMIFFSSFVLFKIGNITWFILFELLFCIYCICKYKKFFIVNVPIVNILYLELILSTIIGMIWNLQESYQKSSIFMGLLSFLTYMVFLYMNHSIKNDFEVIVYVKKALKLMMIIQLLWIPIQYMVYNLCNLDINNLIFVDMLHISNDASFIRAWTWYPAGCCHHPAVIAPMFVIAFCYFNSLPIKLLIIFDSLICGSSTALVGVLIALVLTIFSELFVNRKIMVKRKNIIFLVLLIVFVIIVFYQSNGFDVINERLSYLFTRVTGLSTDDSTSAHFQYYLDYIDIFKKSNIFQRLFGCGEGCSGMWASLIYGRYAELGNWSIECDIVNILVNRGIIGFILFYSFLISIIIKGWKFNKYYSIVVLAIVVQGLGYNVQWDYIILIELLFYLCIKYKIDFFDKKI